MKVFVQQLKIFFQTKWKTQHKLSKNRFIDTLLGDVTQ